jgi:hypothetical protein
MENGNDSLQVESIERAEGWTVDIVMLDIK